MDSQKKLNRKIPRKLVLVPLTIIGVCLVYPLGFLFFGSLFAYRYFIEILVKKLDRKFGLTLKGLDAGFASKTPYTHPSSVIISRLYLDSPVDKFTLISIFNERAIHLWDNQGNLIYPQLRKRIVSKFGYQFWYADDNFNLLNHIRFLDESCPEKVVKESEMMELVSKLSKLSFTEETSPWEIIVVPNYIRDTGNDGDCDSSIKSLLIFRMHHCLCDGYSLLKLWLRLGKEPPSEQALISEPAVKRGFRHWLRVLIEGLYENIKFELSNNMDENLWVQNAVKEWKQILITDQTNLISIPVLKKISQNIGNEVSLPTIMMTSFLQAAAKLMQNKNVVSGDKPVTFVIGTPWPLPNHPVGFSNHFTVVNMSVSVDVNDVKSTALRVAREYERIKNSIIPDFTSFVIDLVGLMPTVLVTKALATFRSTCIFSNFPGPFKPIDICGSEVKDLFGSASPGAPSAVASLAYSYNGRVRYITGGDECNLTKEDATFMATTLEQIVKELENLSSLQNMKPINE